jgi:O-antigen chain-terminating methyltransferase
MSPADEPFLEPSAERITKLLAELPEIYQPIYGHPEITASRSADSHRIDLLTNVIREVSTSVGRPLRILDLGSSQGYVAFRLAELGHHVTGIDFLQQNVALARALQDERPELDVAFIVGDIVDCRSLANLSSYDVVVGFSVLHHIAHRDGHASATALVAELSAHIPHAVFEMALATEPLYWAQALPIDPRVTLAPYAFIRELGQVETHLSAVRRPILFASQTHVLASDGLQEIESWTQESHSSADPGTRGLRRYFMVPSGIVKVAAQFVDHPSGPILDILRQELRREAHVLTELAAMKLEAPRLIEFVDGVSESLLIRTVYPGILLSDVGEALDEHLRSVITGQVLDALAELEAHGLYHADLRLWNVVWDQDSAQARLIDQGGISSFPDDTMWPGDAHFSLFAWIVSLWGPFSDQTGLAIPRSTRIESAELPVRVVSLLSDLLIHPRDDRVFRDVAARWRELQSVGEGIVWPVAPIAWGWLTAIEQRSHVTRVTLASERDALASERDALASERDALASERDALASERDGLQAQLASTEAELLRTRATWSWRLTRPVRYLRSAFR